MSEIAVRFDREHGERIYSKNDSVFKNILDDFAKSESTNFCIQYPSLELAKRIFHHLKLISKDEKENYWISMETMNHSKKYLVGVRKFYV